MKDIYSIDLNTALEDWLACRERFLSRSGRDVLDEYQEANCRLSSALGKSDPHVLVKNDPSATFGVAS